MKFLKRSLFSILVLALMKCAPTQTTTSNEPFAMLGNPTFIQPNNRAGLNIPIGSGSSLIDGFGQIEVTAGFSNTNEGISFRFSTAQIAQAVRSPGYGTVIAVQPGLSNGYVMIMHNARVVSRVINVSPSVALGTYVGPGTTIGTFQPNTGTAVTLAVYLDGDLTCPLSFINSAARSAIVSGVGNTIPLCQR